MVWSNESMKIHSGEKSNTPGLSVSCGFSKWKVASHCRRLRMFRQQSWQQTAEVHQNISRGSSPKYFMWIFTNIFHDNAHQKKLFFENIFQDGFLLYFLPFFPFRPFLGAPSQKNPRKKRRSWKFTTCTDVQKWDNNHLLVILTLTNWTWTLWQMKRALCMAGPLNTSGGSGFFSIYQHQDKVKLSFWRLISY